MNVTIDNAGRIVVPKSARDAMGIAPGDTFALECDDNRLTLDLLRKKKRFFERNGLLVVDGGGESTIDDFNKVLQDVREERESRYMNPDS